MKRTLKKLLLLSLCLCPLNALAQSAEEKGLAIAVAADRRDAGFKDYLADLVMILKNKQGEESTRRLRVAILEVNGDGDKSLSIFDEPRDVNGTALLSFSHKSGTDDQWLYLPALKRVKRIAAADKSGAFVGSEFAYEDVSSQEVEKYTYKHLRDETWDGQHCFVVERYPADKYSGYKRQIVWLDKAEHRTLKIEFYDRKDSLLKTFTARGYRQYLGKHWRPAEMQMVNHQTGKSTLLKWSNYRFQTGLKESDFTQESLKRAQ
jgi:outer membrane lipoprotein-sorting protein